MKKTAPFILLILLFAVAAWYSFIKQPDPVHELPPPSLPPVTPVEIQQATAEAEDGTTDHEPVALPEPLPPLNESDAEVKQALVEIAGTDPLAEYLVKNQLISRIVVTVDSLSSRQVPPPINPVKPAGGNFAVNTEDEDIIMSEENFTRYDGYIALMQNMDSGALVGLYHRYYPLFQQAWEENGNEGSFNDRLLVVIDQLLETPDVPGPIYLTKPEAFYLFEDPELEAMTAGQKILVRMGSANATVVKEKLTEVKMELEP
jgi:hypothetical protein